MIGCFSDYVLCVSRIDQNSVIQNQVMKLSGNALKEGEEQHVFPLYMKQMFSLIWLKCA